MNNFSCWTHLAKSKISFLCRTWLDLFYLIILAPPWTVIISHISGFIWLVNMLNLAKMFIYIYIYMYIYVYIYIYCTRNYFAKKQSYVHGFYDVLVEKLHFKYRTKQRSRSSNVIRNSWQKCLKKKYYIKGTVSRDRQRSNATLISLFIQAPSCKLHKTVNHYLTGRNVCSVVKLTFGKKPVSATCQCEINGFNDNRCDAENVYGHRRVGENTGTKIGVNG